MTALGHLSLFKSDNKIIFLIETLTISIIYALIYWYMGTTEHFNFNNSPEQKFMTLTDAFYFCLTSHTTIGFGDITAKSQLMRMIVISHSLFIILLLIIPK